MGRSWPSATSRSAFNRAFATEDRHAFVQMMIAEIPPRPENADAIRAANLLAIHHSTVARK